MIDFTKPEPAIVYMYKFNEYIQHADFESNVLYIRDKEDYEYTAKITILGEEITTEIIHRKGE